MKENSIKTEEPERQVRVRFAPSPTGDLHVGGVRTALFNWLYARHFNGKFLLRIEDTDRNRSTKEAIDVIFQGLSWLGIDHDEDVIYQSRRLDRHREAVLKMLNNGNAYRCFCDAKALDERREEARKRGKPYKDDHQCLHISEEESTHRTENGEEYTVRLRVSPEPVTFQDGVHGEITVDGLEIDDFIMLRSDGTPTYMIAVVVDDIDMGITHIIRGDDHVSNTPKQILLYRALGYPIPQFAHVPLILGTDKRRLSKRHGDTSITSYRENGFLAGTMINYIGLLGWSPGDDRNVISRRELIELFDIKGINSSAAVFDEAKLRWLNGQYLGQSSFKEVENEVFRFANTAVESGILSKIPERGYIDRAWNLIHTRIFSLADLFKDVLYLFKDPVDYDPKGVKKHLLKEGVVDRLKEVRKKFESLDDFSQVNIEDIIRTLSEEMSIGTGKLIHPLRLSVSGTVAGPGLFEMLEVLGKETVLRRINNAIEYLNRL